MTSLDPLEENKLDDSIKLTCKNEAHNSAQIRQILEQIELNTYRIKSELCKSV